ncbi:MAG: ATPase [Bryobacteraceae bacterium]|jgi:uncharacterized protein YndB with AHSA1/START domain
MKYVLPLAAFVVVLTAPAAQSEVVDSSSGGFTTKTTLSVQATPEAVYRAFVRNIGDWWNSQHTFSGDSHNLSIEEKPGGCFCEKLPNEGGVRHMEVVYLAPAKAIGLAGGLGPLQSIAATGSLRIQLSPVDGATKLEVTYAVVGYLPAGMNTWAAPVSSVLTEQFTRLKNYVEHGDPAPK